MAFAALVWAAMVGTPGASSAPEPVRGEPRPTLVFSVVDDPAGQLDDELFHTCSAHLRELGFSLIGDRHVATDAQRWRERGRGLAPPAVTAIVVWVDLAPDGTPILLALDPRTDLAYRRNVPGHGALGIESTCNVASSAAAALAEGRRPAPELEEVAPPDPPPAPPMTLPSAPAHVVLDVRGGLVVPRTRTHMRLVASYLGSTFAPNVPWQHGLSLAAAWHPASGAYVGAAYDLVLPTRVADELVGFSIRRHPIAIEGGYHFTLGERWDARVGGRWVVDPVLRRTEAEASLLRVAGPAWRVFSGVALVVGAGVSLGAGFRLDLAAGMEVLITRARYVAAEPQRRVLLDPHPVRFVISAGLRFELVRR